MEKIMQISIPFHVEYEIKKKLILQWGDFNPKITFVHQSSIYYWRSNILSLEQWKEGVKFNFSSFNFKSFLKDFTSYLWFLVGKYDYVVTLIGSHNTNWNLLVMFCSLHIALWLKLFEHNPFDAWAIIGFGILNGIYIGLLNLYLGFNSAGFYQVFWSNVDYCLVSILQNHYPKYG